MRTVHPRNGPTTTALHQRTADFLRNVPLLISTVSPGVLQTQPRALFRTDACPLPPHLTQSPQNAELVGSAGVLNAIDALYSLAGESKTV